MIYGFLNAIRERDVAMWDLDIGTDVGIELGNFALKIVELEKFLESLKSVFSTQVSNLLHD